MSPDIRSTTELTTILQQLQARIETLEQMGRANHQQWINLDKLLANVDNFIEPHQAIMLILSITALARKNAVPNSVLYHNQQSNATLRNEENQNSAPGANTSQKRKYDDRNDDK